MPIMPTSKVTQNYQITLPSQVRSKAGVKVGDTLLIEFVEEDNTIRIRLPRKGQRKVMKFGRSPTVEEVERAIERGMSD